MENILTETLNNEEDHKLPKLTGTKTLNRNKTMICQQDVSIEVECTDDIPAND